MPEPILSPVVLVAGDVSLECFSLPETEYSTEISTGSTQSKVQWRTFFGGARLLARIVRLLVYRRLESAKTFYEHTAHRLDALSTKPAAVKELMAPLDLINELHAHHAREFQNRRARLYEARNSGTVDVKQFQIERLKLMADEDHQLASLYRQLRTAIRDMGNPAQSRSIGDGATIQEEIAATTLLVGDLDLRIQTLNDPNKLVKSYVSELQPYHLRNAWLVKSYPQHDTIPGAMRLKAASDQLFLAEALPPEHGQRSGLVDQPGDHYGRWITDSALTLKTVLELRHPAVLFFNDYGNMVMSEAAKSMLTCHREGAPILIVLVTRDLRRLIELSKLWPSLRMHLDRTVIILSSNTARRAGINISQGISWERTAYDLHSQMRGNPMLTGFSQARHIIVRCGVAGALHFHDRSSVLYYSTESMETDAHDRETAGAMGYYSGILGATIVESLLWELAASSDIEAVFRRGVGPAIRRGILNCQSFYREGLGGSFREASDAIDRMAQEDQVDLGKQCPRCLGALNPSEKWPAHDESKSKNEEGGVFEVDVQDDPLWTILDPRQKGFENVAHRIVEDGITKAQGGPMGFPVGRFGNLVTVDRREIEGFRTIRSVMRDYCSIENRERLKKPLSIAVFGPPGAGKSFGVKEIAKSIRESQKEPLLFNVAQFTTPDDLASALISVKDASTGDVVPLAFFDEFDASLDGQHLGWLRYFLAPMHDGQFKYENKMLNVGRSVLVFAGGASNNLSEFCRQNSLDPKDADMFRQAKGPDFVSRLRGVVDIMGVNRTNDWDSAFVIRRAVTLRIILESGFQMLLEDGRCRIDPSVVSAFLKIRRYKHGVRSMQAILEMSQLADANSLQKHQLPIENQLSLHVDAWEFHELINRHVAEGRT